MQPPDVRYARSGDASIAFQTFGTGPAELVALLTGPMSNLDLLWEEPRVVRAFERMARFARVVVFDRRATGLSDHTGDTLTLEQQADDLLAVMDAAGLAQPAFVGGAESARLGVFGAATYPARFSALVLVGSSVTGLAHRAPERAAMFERLVADRWGTGELVALYSPSQADDPRFKRWAARFERNAAPPAVVRELLHLSMQIDLRGLLGFVRVPTLVVHHRDDSLIPIEFGRELAAGIAGARFVELSGRDSILSASDPDPLVDEIEEFVTGRRPIAQVETVLATVLFTDIVDSTHLAAQLGDYGWSELLAAHDQAVRDALSGFRGHEVKTLGDGFLATFDGPARAVRCAEEIRRRVTGLGISVRAGAHTGELQRRDGDVRGLAVNIAARVAALAPADEILVSSTVRDLVLGSGMRFEDCGEHELKGVPGRWTILRLVSG